MSGIPYPRYLHFWVNSLFFRKFQCVFLLTLFEFIYPFLPFILYKYKLYTCFLVFFFHLFLSGLAFWNQCIKSHYVGVPWVSHPPEPSFLVLQMRAGADVRRHGGQQQETSTRRLGYKGDPGYCTVFGRHEWMSQGRNFWADMYCLWAVWPLTN